MIIWLGWVLTGSGHYSSASGGVKSPEFAYPIVNLMRVGITVAKKSGRPSAAVSSSMTTRASQKCPSVQPSAKQLHRHSWVVAEQPDASPLRRHHLEHISGLALDRIYERPSPLHIEDSHMAYMMPPTSFHQLPIRLS